MKMRPYSRIIILFLLSNCLRAQHFSFRAALDTPKQDGLHAMLLPPELRMRSQKNLEDLRLQDSAGNEVPYVIVPGQSHYDSVDFVTYPILERRISKNRNSTFIFSPEEKTLTGVWLVLSNHRLDKVCTVSGSDDRKEWFGIVDKCSLPISYTEQKPLVYCPVYFPEVSYRYYKIVIHDSVSEPLNMHRLGYFRKGGTSGKMIPVSATFTIEQDKTNKRTLLHVKFPEFQHVNSLELKISSPHLYERSARIIVSRTKTVKRRIETQKEVWSAFQLSSSRPGPIEIQPLYEKEFTVEIDNKDSPILAISELTCTQLGMYMIADCRRGERYALFTGDSARRAPQYDLASFVNASPMQLPALNVRSLTPVQSPSVARPAEESSFFQTRTFIWICVGLGGVLVLLFALGLIKEMRKEV